MLLRAPGSVEPPAAVLACSAWHERVLADEVVRHASSGGYRRDHVARLAAYWCEALGGPSDYTARYGDESGVVRQHSGNGPHEDMDARAISCFEQALDDVGPEPPVRGALRDHFAWSTTTAMARYPESADDVPDGLPLPQCS